MTAWVFDVDGVLCNTNELATQEFRIWFQNWSQNRRYYLVTGGRREKTILQLGQDIVDGAEMLFNCIGNCVWQHGEETRVNQFTLTQQEESWLKVMLATSKFPLRTGWHIDLREGSMNFSIVGRNADLVQRAQYRTWDQQHQERAGIARDFVTMFPRFEAYLGGDTSIDICLRGANKGRCVDVIRTHAQDHIFFFGDKCHPGGIDEPFVKRCSEDLGDRIFHVSGYQETWNILNAIYST